MNLITSTQNTLIKHAISLKAKKYILENNECLVESEKIVLDLINANFCIKNIFIEESKKNKYAQLLNSKHCVLISSNVAAKLSDTITNSGIFAIVELPKPQKFSETENYVVLDHLQDPTNLGAIIRSALAFGYHQIILVNSVYPYTPKLIRTSMGYVFKMNLISMTKDEFISFSKLNNLFLISANLNGKNLNEFKICKNTKFGLVIGNEGNGVCEEIQKLCKETVTIEMNKNVESLNAAVSAGILLYELNKNEL